MKSEAAKKNLVYLRADPNNPKHIEQASICERKGFGTGLDPQELLPVLRYIAERGDIQLQYDVTSGRKIITGVVEFIPLSEAMKFKPTDFPDDLSCSPFKIIMENQERIFSKVRSLAKDEDIVYDHGIAMCRRKKGYGTLLLNHALKNTPGKTIVCFIDAAELNKESQKLQLAPNEISFLLHLNAGFVLVDVVDIPVYDDKLVYYCFVKFPEFHFAARGIERLNLAEGDARTVLERIRDLIKNHGYHGRHYDIKRHEMDFLRHGFGFLLG